MAEKEVPFCCPECGAVLTSGRLEGLCPICLLDETEAPDDGLFAIAPPLSGPGLLQLNGYRIVREIARGGMGIIYEAEQAEPVRRVAVKMLLPHLLENPGMRERFGAEVQAMAGLDHPGILPVYEVGISNGLPYFTMKLAPGGNLVKNRERFAGEWRAIATLMAHLADAIQTAHDHGLLHRDLKPANILFDEKQRACVSDFGIAKRIHEPEASGGHNLTKSETMLGTPNYLPPEWASGSAKRATTAGDVYGLGAVLYELLTSQPPHTDTHLTALLRKIADDPVVEPREMNTKIPRDLETICLKAIRKDPSHRYASASAFAADLRNWLGGRPIQARSVTNVEKAWRWAMRNPITAGLGASLALALTGGGAALAHALHTSRQHLHDALVAQAGALRESAKMGYQSQILEALNRAAAINPSADVREEYISALSMTGLKEMRQVSYGAMGVTERVFTDAALTVYTHRDENGVLTVRRLVDSSIISTVTTREFNPQGFGPISPDGRYLVIRPVKQNKLLNEPTVDLPLYLWDIRESRWANREQCCYYTCFSPDSRFLAMGSVDGTVSILDIESGLHGGPFRTGYRKQARPHCFSPDGTKLLLSQSGEFAPGEQKEKTSFVILDAVTGGEILRRQHPEGASVRCAAWRPDGQSVFVGTESYRIYEWPVMPNSLPRQYAGHKGNIVSVEVNSAGDMLLSQSGDKTTRLWSIGSAQTLAILPCTGSEARFTLHGDRFVCEDRESLTLREYGIVPSQVCREFSVPHPLRDEIGSSGCWDIIFSPDGGLLTVGDLDGQLHFDGLTGVLLGKSPLDPCWSLQWQPDGSRLFAVGKLGLKIQPVQYWKAGGSTLSPSLPTWVSDGNKFPLNHCSLSGDGRLLAVGRKTFMEFYDTATGLLTGKAGYVEKGMDAVAVNQDGSLAAASQEAFAKVRLWDPKTGRELKPVPTTYNQGTVLFGQDPQLLYVGSHDFVGCWNVRTSTWIWKNQWETRNPKAAELAMPADFSVLAANCAADTVSLLDPLTGREITRLRHASPHLVSSLAFSPDATRLATFCTGHIVQLWDLPRLRSLLSEYRLDWPSRPASPAPSRVWRIADNPGVN